MESHELDLHALTWPEALREFADFYNLSLGQATDSTTVRLSVIHGYGSTGEGDAIRNRLRAFLEKHGDYLEFTPGENVDGNRGCTVVKPMKRLPDEDELLAKAIWDYCQRPRTRSKITGKFHKHGESKTIQAIRLLEIQGRLTRQSSVSLIKYVSA